MKNLVARIIHGVYFKVFKEKMSDDVKSFTFNFGVITLGYIGMMFFTFLFQVLAGRFLGPSEYGKYALISSISMFLYIPMIIGIPTALIKYNSSEKSPKAQKANISTAFIMTLFLSAVFFAIFIIFSRFFSGLLSTTSIFIMFSAVFALFYSLDTLTKSGLRSLHNIKSLSLLYFLYGLIMFAAFFVFHYFFRGYQSAMLSVFAAYFVVIVLSFIFLRKRIGIVFNKNKAKIFAKYGSIAVSAGIATSITANISKIFLNKYLGLADVGLFNAYYSATITIATTLNTMLMITFFPTASKLKEKKYIFIKIRKIIPYILSIGLIVIAGLAFIILKIYGSEYSLNLWLIILFALAGILTIVYSLYIWTFASEGMNGIKWSTISTVMVSLIVLALSYFLISRYNLFGAVFALVAGYCFGIIYINIIKHKIL